MNKEKIIAFWTLILFGISIFIIVRYSNWQTALGVYLLINAYNLEARNTFIRAKKD